MRVRGLNQCYDVVI